MSTPQFEIDELNAILNGENIELLREDLAFSVAACIVKYRDPELLAKLPPWVVGSVREMCEVYRRDGSYKVVSNLGEADHSEMVGKLAKLLEPSV
jgi:hypothetical protein